MVVAPRAWSLLTIIMCNHASRIDWLIALWCGNVDVPVRVSFLTEGPMQFLPIVGWMRKLCEDIFLWRSFKVDKARIDANIASFKATGTQRALFLAIEGAIVDQGVFDQHYIRECNDFCASLGYAPFNYVLTPRYKGIHSLAQHAGAELFSATCAFTRRGRMLNIQLTDPERVVPDLFTIFADEVEVTCHFDRLLVSAEQEQAKRQCMANYKYRDEMLACFHEHGRFPGGLTYRPLPTELRKRAGCFAAMLACAGVLPAYAGWPLLLPKLLGGMLAVLATCHALGELISGESRESIPFETIFKSFFYAGRDAKLLQQQAGKKVDCELGASEHIAETAHMLSLMTKFPVN